MAVQQEMIRENALPGFSTEKKKEYFTAEEVVEHPLVTKRGVAHGRKKENLFSLISSESIVDPSIDGTSVQKCIEKGDTCTQILISSFPFHVRQKKLKRKSFNALQPLTLHPNYQIRFTLHCRIALYDNKEGNVLGDIF